MKRTVDNFRDRSSPCICQPRASRKASVMFLSIPCSMEICCAMSWLVIGASPERVHALALMATYLSRETFACASGFYTSPKRKRGFNHLTHASYFPHLQPENPPWVLISPVSWCDLRHRELDGRGLQALVLIACLEHDADVERTGF